jgi:hypothetical protein
MPESLFAGLSLVLVAGVFQGSFMLPSKAMRGWAWENYCLIFAFTTYLICPGLLAIAIIPHVSEVSLGATPASLATVIIFGAAWGVGAVTFGLVVEAVGLALGFAIILGIAATAGTLIGVMWMAGFAFYGAGVRKLGDLGPSRGWAILMSTMVLVAKAQGLATGEWKGAPSRAKRQLSAGLLFLLAAIAGLGYANQ